jgi:hypothetical protein
MRSKVSGVTVENFTPYVHTTWVGLFDRKCFFSLGFETNQEILQVPSLRIASAYARPSSPLCTSSTMMPVRMPVSAATAVLSSTGSTA